MPLFSVLLPAADIPAGALVFLKGMTIRMKKFLKVLALGIAASLMALSFAACGGDPASTGSNGESSEAAALDLVKDGTLIMGINAEFPPFEFQEGGAVVGVDAEIMEAIAKKLGLTLEIKDMAFESLPDALGGGTIDLIAAGYTVDPTREETMDFTDTYYTALQTVIVKADSGYASKDDLKDKKIGVQTGTTGSSCAKELTDKENVIGYGNGSLAVDALLTGNVDAVIIDNNPAKEYKTKHGDAVTLLENQFDEEEYAIAVKKGNKDLLEAVNNALKEIKADGTFQKIIEKYIR